MKLLVGIFAVLNLSAAGLFAVLAFVAPLSSELSVRMAFTELDRAGAINVTALRAEDARYAFDPNANLDYRRTVPVHIAAAPLTAQRTNALVGMLISAINAVVLATVWIVLRRPEPTPHNLRLK